MPTLKWHPDALDDVARLYDFLAVNSLDDTLYQRAPGGRNRTFLISQNRTFLKSPDNFFVEARYRCPLSG